MKELIFLLHRRRLTASPRLLIGLVCKPVACGVWPKTQRGERQKNPLTAILSSLSVLLTGQRQTNTEDGSHGSERGDQKEGEQKL